MKKIIMILAVSLAFQSCSDNCDEGNQATPASFFIKIVNETSEENVFENGTYTSQQIIIEDLDEASIPYKFIQNSNLIQIFPPVVNPTGNLLLIKLNNETTLQMDEINVNYIVSSKKGECFTTFKIENILFPNNASEFIEGIYVIKI